MTATDQQLESAATDRIGERFEPALSDEFASRALARADRLQAVVPGVTAVQLAVVLLLAAVYLTTSFYALHHTDLWAHLAFGRAMVDGGALLAAEPFGIETGDQPFVNVSWLAQIAGYQIYDFAGPTGLRLLHAVLATAAFGCLLPAVRSRRVSWPWAIAAAATAYLLSSTVVGVIRPQLVGMVALPLVLLAIGRIGRRRDPLVWLPLVFLLWANLHGSFVLGIFVLLVAVADAVLTARRQSTRLPLKPQASSLTPQASSLKPHSSSLVLLTSLCLLATWINPLGPRLWLAVLGFSGQANIADIVEWRPLVLNSFGGAMFFATLLVTAVLLRLSPRRITLLEAVLLVVFAAATLLSMRFIAWWALIWPWVAAPHAMAVARAWIGRVPSSATADRQPVRTLIGVAAIFLALVWAPGSHALLADRPLTLARAANSETPILLAEELNNRQFEGKVFAPLAWADYLLWSSEGRLRPLVYSHVHLIDPSAWSDYRQIDGGAAGWLRIADRAELRYLILPRRDETARLIVSHPRTVIRYQDQQSLVVELLPPAEEEVSPAAPAAREDAASAALPTQVPDTREDTSKGSRVESVREKFEDKCFAIETWRRQAAPAANFFGSVSSASTQG